VLIHAKKRDFSREADLFGIYPSRAKAQAHLRRLADEHNLCHATLGLEKIPPGSARGCFGYQVRRCQGACVGAETLAGHTARVHEALAASRVVEWPHAGPIAIAERDANSGRVAWHVIDHWCYLGLCRSIEGIGPLVANAGEMRAFDFDVYGLISRRLVSGELEWIACDVRPCFSLALQQAPRFADHAIPMRRNSSGKRNLQAIPDAAQYALSFA
jgi:DNA polymerase-3 subunit epsilon